MGAGFFQLQIAEAMKGTKQSLYMLARRIAAACNWVEEVHVIRMHLNRRLRGTITMG